METILSLITIVVLSLFLVFSGSKIKETLNKPLLGAAVAAVPTPTPVLIIHKLTRSEIIQMLAKLAKTPPPTNLSMGAMCYSVACPPNRAEYVCPKCGEKTLYVGDDKSKNPIDVELVRTDIPACRKWVSMIKQISLKLDESQFCKKCSPNVKSPTLILSVKYEGEKTPNIVKGISENDLQIIWEFLNGKDKHSGERGEETPLKNYLQRLEQLLGVKLPK